MVTLFGEINIVLWYRLPQSYIVKPFATIPKDLPQPYWHWLTGGTFDSATGGSFQSDTDGTFHSDIPGTFESDMGGTFKVLQSCVTRKVNIELKTGLVMQNRCW